MRETVWFSQNKHTIAEAGFVVVSFLISFYLLFLPYYSLIDVISPAWPVMTLCYWRKRWSQFGSVWMFWGIGFLLDIMSSSVIGSQAVALVMVYSVMSLMDRARLVSKSIYSEAMLIFLLVFIFQFICLLVRWGFSELDFSILYFTQTLLSAFLWPWFVILLQFFHRFFRRIR